MCTRLLILLLLVAAATAAIACLAIYNRKRRQPTQPAVAEGAQPIAVEETQPTVIEEAQPTAAEEPQSIVAEEAEPTPAEETQPTPVEEVQAGAVPEAQPMVVQEAEPTAVAETKPTAVEETQPIAVEELQPTVAEETQPTVVEEAQPRVADEAQPTCAEEVPREEERKRQKPEERGGRPRGPAPSREQGSTPETKPRRLKPEILCWKRERQWMPVVEVPEDLLANSGLAVLQNGLPLTQDELREGCLHLKEAYGQVVVQWNEDEVAREVKIALGEGSYLLFKLSQNLNQGRRVKSPSAGSYLVMVPQSWERDEALSGPPPVTPESVFLTGYQAHFFELERGGNEKIAFRTPEGKSVIIGTKASICELVGTCLNDATEGIGPLFGERPPQIRALQEQAWKGVGTIVVGEEGTGKGKWRWDFSPVQDLIEQDLPSEVAARKSGWYFLRFYDTNGDLIESLDFRFICALKEIRILQPSPLPSEDGHRPVRVEFLHEPGCAVQPIDGSGSSAQIEYENDKTILTIPPDPTCDKTRWLVCSEDAAKVEVTILVERLWWAVGEDDKEPSQWEDQPFTLSRDDFAATSRKALWLRVPRLRWVNKILAGFEQPKARPYNVRVTEKTIAVPLREFSDSAEVGDRTQKHPFKVWIECDGGLTEGVVAIIPASQSVVAPARPKWVGFGRKKTAEAKAVLQPGSGEITVNERPLTDYFKETPPRAKRFLQRLLQLPQVRAVLSQMDAFVDVKGSNPTKTRQAKAAAHALARALASYDSKLKPLLKQAGFGGVRVTKVPTMERER